MDALVNAALMAGENVSEHVVRKVFGSSIDLVVHLDRDAVRDGDRPLRRRVMEVLAVVPSLHDDFTVEPIFLRDDMSAGLRWTGARPPRSVSRSIESMFGSDALHRVFGDGFAS